MKISSTFTIMALLFCAHSPLSAQNPWSAELRPGLNFATQDLGDAELKTGIGFEAALGYRFMPHLGAYVGWGWTSSNPTLHPLRVPGNSILRKQGTLSEFNLIHPFNTSSKLSYLLEVGRNV